MQVTCAGILVVDIIAADLPKISSPGELTFTSRGIEVHMGGHAGNVSIDLRKLGLPQGEVSCVGAVGEDVFGDFLENLLKSHGLVTHLQRMREAGTSKDMVLVVSGEDRRFHTDIGANWHLSPEHVTSVLEDEKPTILYTGGIGITGRFDEELPTVLQKAKEMNCLTFLDAVKPYKRGWDLIFPALKVTDIFHCNQDEAKGMTGKDDPKEAARALIKKGASLVIISMGEKGLIAMTRNLLLEMPSFKVQVVDPTGAGDAMCAGIISGLLKTMGRKRFGLSEISTNDLPAVLLEGEAAGAACVTMVGTTTAVTERNVKRLLDEQGREVLNRTRIRKIH
ncbi:carbohydrate kinase family protein [Candidatus Bathyarchaeota archaeon]|nr:carbohydrate kinase family protein [Candidatus Bathyarchaeota archaeon]